MLGDGRRIEPQLGGNIRSRGLAWHFVVSPTVTLPGPELGLAPVVVIAGVTGFALVYAVGLSVLGGLLGGYVYEERQP